MELPAALKQGERSRLFPVLADTSKEGRTLSIILACLENVGEFQRALLAALGQRLGARSRVEAYTEVVLAKGGEKKHRPDGLIIVRHGPKHWSALVEAKVGNAELTPEQLEGYLELAKLNGVDALLTLSNQFAPLPTHHPVQLPLAVRKKAELYHFSWMFVLTQASLLLRNGEISDSLQRVLLNEMERFLLHPSAGVRGFDQMPAAWSELVNRVHAGAKLSANSQEAREVAGAWHQELRDLGLILSRQLKAEVTTRVPRAHAADPSARLKATVGDLSENHCLGGTLIVPGAAAPMEICADIQKRSISVSMKLRAPGDRKSTKAKLSWLLRQLQRAEGKDIHIRMFWSGRGGHSQFPLPSLRENPDLPAAERPGLAVLSFEILLVKDLGGRFSQRRNFIVDLERTVPNFYEQVGQHLRAWQEPAPRLPEAKAEPASVAPDALREELEVSAVEGQEAPSA